MKNINYLFLIALISIACESTTGTSEENNPPPQPTFEEVNFIPFKVGNFWVYEDDFDGTDTTFVTKDTTISGEGFFKQSNPEYYSDGEYLGSYDYYYAYRDSGLVEYDKDLNLRMFYRYPDGQTTIYSQKGRSNDRFNWYTKIVSTDTTITTETGTYNCLVYHSFREDTENGNQVDIKERMYFSEDVGIVRQEFENLYFRSEDMLEANISN